jgi:NFU1 iron-sulfur cluster scaffold homolog, mitochondrial
MSIFGIRSRTKSLVRNILGLEGPPSASSRTEVRKEPVSAGAYEQPEERNPASVYRAATEPEESVSQEPVVVTETIAEPKEDQVEESSVEIEEAAGSVDVAEAEEEKEPSLKLAKPVELSVEMTAEELDRLKAEQILAEEESSTPQVEAVRKEEIHINVQETPNPDAYMFQVSKALLPSGTHEFKKGDDLSLSPLAKLLLEQAGIELILIAPRFVTIRKSPEVAWFPLADQATEALRGFLQSGEAAVKETASAPVNLEDISELERQILELLDEEIRPAIAMDGGDLIYHGFQDGIVKIQLTGACGTCPSSTATLYYGVQNLLMEEIPEVKGVEQISA